MKKLLLNISLLLLCPFCITAQNQQNKLTRLYTALHLAANDTIKTVFLDSLMQYYSESNRDSAMFYTEQALQMTDKLNQPLWKASLLLNKSYFIYRTGDIVEALRFTNQSMSLAQNAASEKNAWIRAADKFAGKPHQYRANIFAGVAHLMGLIYSSTSIEKSNDYFKEEIRISNEIGASDNLVGSNMNIGEGYLELGKPDSALMYSRVAFDWTNKTGQKEYQGYILMVIGNIYLQQKQTDSAKYYYANAIVACKAQNNLTVLSLVNNTFAGLFAITKQPDSVLYYAKTAYTLANNLKEPFITGSSAKIMSDAYAEIKKTDSALYYLGISKNLSDSLNNDHLQKLTQFQNTNFEEQQKLEKEAQQNKDAKTRIATIALFTGLGLLIILVLIVYRNNLHKQKANVLLEDTLANLKSTQSQLIQSEKMASLGELTAGIAHEIQNPLNFVNNFSEVNTDLLEELKGEADKGNLEEIKAIANDVIENSKKINHHGQRAGNIVKGMLQHSKAGSGKKELTDINKLVDEYIKLAHRKSAGVELKTNYDEYAGSIHIVAQDIAKVLLNIYNNALYAVNEQRKLLTAGYEPLVSIATKKINNKVEITISDNGVGIPQKNIDKIFQPFFTTKPTGQGTGLGLSLSYDIVKAHGGQLSVEMKEKEGSTFIIELPVG